MSMIEEHVLAEGQRVESFNVKDAANRLAKCCFSYLPSTYSETIALFEVPDISLVFWFLHNILQISWHHR